MLLGRRYKCGIRHAGDPWRGPAARRRVQFRPQLEALEERTLLTAGSPDPSFGMGGLVTTDFGGTSAMAHDVAIQSDGKIVVVGQGDTSAPGQTFKLARYTSDGSLDAAFGSGGKVTTSFTSSDTASAVVLQSDGKIVVAGTARPDAGSADFALARYNADGSLDASFGTAGKVMTTFPGGSTLSGAGDVALQPDGKIVVVGGTGPNRGGQFVVARYNPNGTLDGTFGTGGQVTTGFLADSGAGGVAIQADGKLVVAGETSNDDLYYQGAMARYTTGGNLDSTFGTGGKVVSAGAPDGNDVLLQTDGKIIVIGFFSAGPGSTGIPMKRFNPDGSVDAGFGPGTSYNLIATRGVLQPDGKIVVGGGQAIARFTSDGAFDVSFGSAGRVATPGYEVAAVALQADGKIVTAGWTTVANTVDFAVARYLGAATPNERFVTQMYRDVLQRPVDGGGLAFWSSQLDQGASRFQVTLAVEGSDEYRAVVVQELYGKFLSRAADPAGLANWMAFLAAGGSREQLAAILLGSPEYSQNHGGGSNDGFLQAVYADVLGRAIDPGGRAAFGGALAAGVSPGQIATTVLASDEAVQDLVQSLYQRYLHRPADPGGLSTFADAVRHGIPDPVISAVLISSDEYFARV